MITIQGKNTYANVFTDELDQQTYSDLYKIVNHHAFSNPVIVMPDVHAGKGAVIGFTMLLADNVIPNIVGVDIGCGMLATIIPYADDFSRPDFDSYFRSNVPMGQTVNTCSRFCFDKDFNYSAFQKIVSNFDLMFKNKYGSKFAVAPKIDLTWIENTVSRVQGNIRYIEQSQGSQGGGNHFFELSRFDNNILSVIHTGSRKLGLLIAEYWQNIANTKSNTPNDPLNTLYDADFYGYMIDMLFAQYYASINRKYISETVCEYFGKNFDELDSFQSVHNYIDPNDWIIRKGAIRNYVGEKGIIPLNMEDGVIVFEGNSNKDWNYSCPHGAGRLFSRSKAKAELDHAEYVRRMEGIYCSTLGRDTLDESPMAYKNPENIIKALVNECGIEKYTVYKPVYVAKSGKITE